VIARNGVPVAQIVPVRKSKFNFGFLKGRIPPIADKLLFAMTEEEADKFVQGSY
jgi:antitoxin (DNA-binding transcriptional repressor) of toxin-antitoxin stability system